MRQKRIAASLTRELLTQFLHSSLRLYHGDYQEAAPVSDHCIAMRRIWKTACEYGFITRKSPEAYIDYWDVEAERAVLAVIPKFPEENMSIQDVIDIILDA